MSPANRSNPDMTDADGHFGWDVFEGYYKVRAEKDGCVSPADPSQTFVESDVLTIPPAVTDLDLRLQCASDQAPAVTLDPTSLDFGTRLATSPSASQSVTITNTGDANLNVSGASLAGDNPSDYEIVSDSCSGTAVAQNATCSVAIRFTPQAAGARNATLQIESNASTSPDSVSLSGVGVIYAFQGFFRPVDNLDDENQYVLNSVKAGSAVPVKFSLSGNQGLSIFATATDGSSYPKSGVIPCNPTAEVAAVEDTVTAGQSTLQYDASLDQYTYVWKTDKRWAGTCRQLEVKLADGNSHRASFKLLK
jgi:hypothetical protein